MPPYNLSIVANNQAGDWASWDSKIAAIKAFYAPVCSLNITLVKSSLTPQFTSYEGTGTNQIDEGWYEANVLPLSAGANIAMFVVPPTDHPNLVTLGGIETGYHGGIWETTVFSDETSHNYVDGVDQGQNAVVLACHELSHVFYAMLQKTDNTHLHFYSGQPQKVLGDFDFEAIEVSWLQQLINVLKSILSMETNPDESVTPSNVTVASPQASETSATASNTTRLTLTTFPTKILAWAKIITQEEGARPELHNPGNLGYTTLTASWGAAKGPAKADGGYLCMFLTDQKGENALCNFLVLGCEDELVAFHQARTLAEFTKVYAGNPPQGYIDAIVSAMGGDPNIQISTFLN